MKIHFAGAGGCVEYMARRLIREGHELCLLDHDEVRCQELEGSLDAQIIHGNAVCIADWQKAQLEQSELFIACTDSDEVNILSCLVADDLAPIAPKIIRLRTAEYSSWKRIFKDLKVKVDRVVHPEQDVLQRILRVMHYPGIADIREFADHQITVFEMNIVAGDKLAGRTMNEIKDMQLLSTARICFIFRGMDVLSRDEVNALYPGDHVYIATLSKDLNTTLEILGLQSEESVKGVFILGGGELGLELARALEQEKVSVKLFERDAQRCEFLAGQLNGTTILHMDGTAENVLQNENIEGVDAFVLLTGNDDTNLITSLLARRYGVRKVIPLLNRIDYIPISQRLGISTSVSPRIKAADAMLEYIRKGGVTSVRTLGMEHAEVLELLVASNSPFCGKAIKDLALTAGTSIGAILPAGKPPILPGGDVIIQPGDTLVLFAKESTIRDLQKAILD